MIAKFSKLKWHELLNNEAHAANIQNANPGIGILNATRKSSDDAVINIHKSAINQQ